ncbi:MAG: abortive infection family protein [Paludibacteraceae bacterium]|nr:abortive infection family protein [Paludibacteraceae bacterium]
MKESATPKDDFLAISQAAINTINNSLQFSNVKLVVINKSIQLVKADEEIIVKSNMSKMITYEYIAQLPERIKQDLENNDYDSVITKSRTLLEEVFIYIIEKTTHERYKSNGKLISIHSEVQDILGMKPNKDWDHRVSDLLNGFNKIISSISDMRNMNSDSHGVGSSRITIKNKEARLVANSAMSIAEYYLSVFLKDRV